MKLNLQKFLKIGGLLSLIILFSQQSFSQTNLDKKYVSIIVQGISSSQEANNVDVFIRNQPGVLMSRMDVNTNMYYGIFDSSFGLGIADYKNWIMSLGYTIKCTHIDSLGEERVVLLSEFDCDLK